MLQGLCRVGGVDVIELQEGAAGSHPVQAWEAEWSGVKTAGRRLRVSRPAHALPWNRFEPQPDLRREVEVALGAELASYDLVAGRYLWPLSQLASPGLARTLVDLDDWRYRTAQGADVGLGLQLLGLRKRYGHFLAQRALHRVSRGLTVSATDFGELKGRLPVALVPNVPWQVPTQPPPAEPGGTVLFVGSLWYGPNAHAVDWLCQRVWPHVIARRPRARMNIIGAGSPAVRAGWARYPGVLVPGFAESLEAVYAQSSVVAAPVFCGGGSNIKLLEALAYRRVCVTTSFAQAAFEPKLSAARQLLVADEPEAFADHLVCMLDAPNLKMADDARQTVLEEFSPAAMVSAVEYAALEALRS